MDKPTVLTAEQIAAWLPHRDPDAHKGTYGRVMLAAGSYGMAGAARLAAEAALRCGVGLAVLALPDTIYPIVAAGLPEAVYRPLDGGNGGLPADAANRLAADLARADALVIGCGLGRRADTDRAVRELLSAATCPVILDADGINSAGTHILNRNAIPADLPVILTPHEGEMARLWGVGADTVHRDRTGFARRTADQSGAVVVLKGHRTLIAAPDGTLLENSTGNDGMATGGSGDALAGMIGGLAAQGLSPLRAAAGGVYLHGLAGDLAAARMSRQAMLPSDLIAAIGNAFQQLIK